MRRFQNLLLSIKIREHCWLNHSRGICYITFHNDSFNEFIAVFAEQSWEKRVFGFTGVLVQFSAIKENVYIAINGAIRFKISL